MSVLLSWENPPELWMAEVRSANLYRGTMGDDGMQKIATSISWGSYEDIENDDPGLKYRVDYLTEKGSLIVGVPAEDIRVWKRPPRSCKITFALTRPDGSPWGGRRIHLESLTSALSDGWIKDYTTNAEGLANVFLQYGSLVRIEVSGLPWALELATPEVVEISWDELEEYGIKRDVDPRRAIGGATSSTGG